MVVPLQNHSGILNKMTCITAAEPWHQLLIVSGKAPFGTVKNCPGCPKGASGGLPTPLPLATSSWYH